MIAILRAEARKLNGSLALLFALLVPAMPALLAVLALTTRGQPPEWSDVTDRFVMPLWAMFILPMGAATFCTLLAQTEYRAKAWDHWLTLPYPRWQLLLAKLIVAVAALAGMTLLAFAFAFVLVGAAGWITGAIPNGSTGLDALAPRVGRLLGAAFLLFVLQMWAALRFANFVVPLAIGIGGTLVGLAVLITGTDQADWFPWVLPLRAIEVSGSPAPAAIGLAGGTLAIIAMLVDLSRRAPR